MLKLRALNRESSSDEDGPAIRREAQEEIVLDLYNKALRLQCNNQLTEAEQIVKQLVNDNIPQLETEGGLPKTMSTLKFSCLTNLGSIAMKKGETQAALDHYLLASELDGKDVTLWYKIGKLALKHDRFRQAAYAFHMGLECSENHWPCLDELITLLFSLRDTIACLKYIGKALILDASYLKGFILRKSIYESNKAAKEYYQLFNPDYIYEPDLDVDIDEEIEAEVLQKAQLLCDRINKIEKSVAPKGLSTIPLPKPLEDFTWLSLGQTLVDLHQYITENNMSHFTLVDLKKCMSVKIDDVEINKETGEPTQLNGLEVKSGDNKDIIFDNNDVEQASDKSDTFQLERRLSQFSETDTNENKTPIQTDNDEMEQDADETVDQEEQNENKLDKSKNQNRTMKRKRDLVSELQIWGWHSKRKSAKRGKCEKDFTIEDAFQRIIPAKLLPNGITIKNCNPSEDSMNTMEIYHLHAEERSLLSPLPPFLQDTSLIYFGTEAEKADVQKFWTQKRVCCDVVNLIEDYVYELSNLWTHKWPAGLFEIYMQIYLMFREHIDHPQIFCNKVEFDVIRKDALATLLYVELVTYHKKWSDKHRILGASINQLEFVTGWDDDWGEEHLNFFLRFYWLKAHLYRKDVQNLFSITALQLIKNKIKLELSKLNSPFELVLPNCGKYGKINLEITEKILKSLEMMDSLSRLEELYDKQQYVEVADIIKNTFKSFSRPRYKRMTRQAQLAMLLHALWYVDFSECFIWSEECLYEAVENYIKNNQNDEKWIAVIEKCLLIMRDIIKKETVIIVDCLSETQRSRLVTSLCHVCCKQINSESSSKVLLGSTVPWIILHYILLREEHRQQAQKPVSKIRKDESNSKSEDTTELVLPPSIAVLFSAHEFLGPKGWCLTNQGELLHFMIDYILLRLDAPILEPYRDKIDIHLEQAFFCLYQHPSKKNKVSRHLADHNVNPLPLSWERAQQVYEFFCPDALPEFDSYKSISISSELEQLLQRISALVPSECDPQPLVSKVTEFVNGTIESLPSPISFPIKTRSIYYLLGDFYFKQSDVKRSLKYFLLDLCICPLRLDTWACMALGIASQLEYKLTHCERFKNEMEFLDKAKSAEVCFKEALKLSNDHTTLWIEFGSFEYMVHSFCSRVLKYESDTLSMEKFEVLETKKEEYLNCAQSSFIKALDLYQPDQCDADERWLHHYILAKIAEKHQKEPSEYLEHYYLASKLLEENNACYPEKINYNNPQHLSLEALEVYYRINASILKYLELHEGKPILHSLGKCFKKYLDIMTLSKPAGMLVSKSQLQVNRNDEEITSAVTNCINDLITKIEKDESNNDKMKDVIMISDSDDDKESKPLETNQQFNNTDSNKNKQKDASSVIQDHNYTDAREIASKNDDSASSSSSSSDSSSSDSDSESTTSSSSTSSSDNTRNLSDNEVLTLVEKCISGLEDCIRRLPQNYKALYRLSHMYFHYIKKKDLVKAKQLLLGEYKCKNGVIINGLFSDRKNSNFFNGIWRIPSSEIDRPGSLSAHMGRCVNLLLQILRSTNDHKTLLDLCLQLRKIPDADKVYIRHSEREQLSEQALSLCIQTLRNAIKNVTDTASTEKLMIDIFKAYQRSQKSLAHKESVFASMLGDVYKKYMNDKVPESVSILDLAMKHCQQNRVLEKMKKQQNISPSIQKLPLSTNSPVLTTTSASISHMSVLKKPTLGRPRGRPPGPKVSPTLRSPRGRPPTITSGSFMGSTMFDQNAALDYLRKYQKDLLLQYSKTLNIQQIAQMTQNQIAQSTMLLQSMQQMGLLNQQFVNPNFAIQNVFGTKSNDQLNFEHLQQQATTASSTPKKSSSTSSSILKSNSTNSSPTTKMHLIQSNPTKPSQSLNSSISPQHMGSPGFSPVNDSSKFKSPSPSTSYQQSNYSLSPIAKEKDILLKERPSLSITPVQQQNSSKLVSPVKTLQEKLADKQKQNMKATSRNLDFYSSTAHKTTPAIPSFAKESGISISHVQPLPKPGTESSSTAKKDIPQNVKNHNTPISLSVIKKLEEAKDTTDDVIIIE